MTAKEVAESIINGYLLSDCVRVGDYLEKSDATNRVKRYAQNKVREQRHLMIREFEDYTDINALFQAPEPEFE